MKQAANLFACLFHRKRKLRTVGEKEAFLEEQFNEKARFLTDGNRFACQWEDRWLCPDDATRSTPFDKHYVYHTSWAARVLADTRPGRHVDIGSCLRFATLVSAFIPMDFYDFRPAKLTLSNLEAKHADVTALPFADNSIASLSCMHVVEHIGLERYGDPFDPQGDLKAMAELQRVTALAGQLLFVVPVAGVARIQYNAHRIYTFRQVVETFSLLKLRSFVFLSDKGEFILSAQEKDCADSRYGCGCFLFTKAFV